MMSTIYIIIGDKFVNLDNKGLNSPDWIPPMPEVVTGPNNLAMILNGVQTGFNSCHPEKKQRSMAGPWCS